MCQRVNRHAFELWNALLALLHLLLFGLYIAQQPVQLQAHQTQYRTHEQRRVAPGALEAQAFALTPVIEAVKAGTLLADTPGQEVAPLQQLVRTRQRTSHQPTHRKLLQRIAVAAEIIGYRPSYQRLQEVTLGSHGVAVAAIRTED